MLRIDLDDDVTQRLFDAFERLPPADDLDDTLADLLAIGSCLPQPALRQILRFRGSPYAPSGMLVTGLPVDRDLPPTPVDATPAPIKPSEISNFAIMMLAVLLGEPVAYRAEKNGELVQNVYPTPAQRNTPSNDSSAAPLGFHTELTFSRSNPERLPHEASPDFVLLLALRCPEDRLAITALVDVRMVCHRLDERHLTALRAPQFQLMAPYSFTRDGDGSRPWSSPVPLLRGPDEAPSLAFDTACGVRALTEEAEEAIAALTAVCNEPDVSESVRLRAGDLLAINNRRAAHSRSSFSARFDGQDRWLQRVYVRSSIWPLTVESAGSFRVVV
jgi:L-asparagine oxygenase